MSLRKILYHYIFFMVGIMQPMPVHASAEEHINIADRIFVWLVCVSTPIVIKFLFMVSDKDKKCNEDEFRAFCNNILYISGAFIGAKHITKRFLSDSRMPEINNVLNMINIILLSSDILSIVLKNCCEKMRSKGIYPQFLSLHSRNFLSACRDDDTECALAILERYKTMPQSLYINQQDKRGYTALMYACKHSNKIIVQAILDNMDLFGVKVDISAEDTRNHFYYRDGDSAFSIACEHCPDIAFALMPYVLWNEDIFDAAFAHEKNATVALECAADPDFVFCIKDHAQSFFQRQKEYFLKSYRNIDLNDRFKPLIIHPDARAAIFSIIMNKDALQKHPFQRLYRNALRQKHEIECSSVIDQRELMRIDFYTAYNAWIMGRSRMALSDFFVFLPARMVLNMKIIQKSMLYEPDDNCFIRGFCDLYEEWFGKDSDSKHIKLFGENALEIIYSKMFKKMLIRQLHLYEEQEKNMLDGLQVYALSNTYCKSAEHLAAILGILISLEKDAYKKKMLCKRLSRLTEVMLAQFFTDKHVPYEIERSSQCYFSHSAMERKVCAYISIQSGFFESLICSDQKIKDNSNLGSHVLCNHETEVLDWIKRVVICCNCSHSASCDHLEKAIPCYSKLFRYGSSNPKYSAAWNKKLFGAGSIDEYTGKEAV